MTNAPKKTNPTGKKVLAGKCALTRISSSLRPGPGGHDRQVLRRDAGQVRCAADAVR